MSVQDVHGVEIKKIRQKSIQQATHLLKPVEKMYEYEMDQTSILEDTERTRFCPQTDGQTGKLKFVGMDFKTYGKTHRDPELIC